MNSDVLATADLSTDQVAGQSGADPAIIQYGDYACAECGRLHEILRRTVDDDGHPVRYVFRYLPLDSGRRGRPVRAIAAQAAARQGKFWEMHDALFQHASEADPVAKAAADVDLDMDCFHVDCEDPATQEQVDQEIAEAASHGIDRVPTLIIRGKEYLGAWDAESINQALNPPVARQVKEVASRFAEWAAASGAILIVFAAAALLIRNSPLGHAYEDLWNIKAGVSIAGQTLSMSFHHWVNDFLMAIFFLVVGLELKREIISGELSTVRSALFPAAAAVGGMLIPAGVYLVFNAGTESAAGWGVPMATDIAFTLGVLALLGSSVPTSMKVFATALAVVDDLGAILVLAVAYNHGISWNALGGAAMLVLILIGLNRAQVYALWPYLVVGLVLWIFVYGSGMHATLAGVLLAATIPTRSKAPLKPLLAQEAAGVKQSRRRLRDRDGDTNQERARLAKRVQVIESRLNPPAERMEHRLQPWSSYFVLPVFALANAGIVISLQSLSVIDRVSLGIIIGLVVGKPAGILLATWLVDKSGLGEKPKDASWSDIIGVGFLCGIGFTMSIFISTEAFDSGERLGAAKFAVMIGSLIAAASGVLWLSLFRSPRIGSPGSSN